MASEERLSERLSHLPPTFTARAATDAALSPRDLAMLREAGEIDELSRGVYRRADAEPTAYLDLLAVCARAPHAVVCGESALSLHELVDDIPHEVHIAVSRGSHRPSISYPHTRVSQYAAATFSFAVEQIELAPGETVPVYSAARSVVDAMRLGGAAGRGLALSALNRYLRRNGRQGVADLQRAARELGGMSAIRPAIEAVLA
jgi:predicted transcriptional regulator of viral defense system